MSTTPLLRGFAFRGIRKWMWESLAVGAVSAVAYFAYGPYAVEKVRWFSVVCKAAPFLKSTSNFASIGIYWYRVIQSSEPPSRAEMGSSYQKLTNAFSNTSYLKII